MNSRKKKDAPPELSGPGFIERVEKELEEIHEGPDYTPKDLQQAIRLAYSSVLVDAALKQLGEGV